MSDAIERPNKIARVKLNLYLSVIAAAKGARNINVFIFAVCVRNEQNANVKITHRARIACGFLCVR